MGDFLIMGLITFEDEALSVLNPCWFGANGSDEKDDTKAFLTVLDLAKHAGTSVNITVPVGRYIISEQLTVESINRNEKAINIIGASLSGNTIKGS